jgi:heme exporter protein A
MTLVAVHDLTVTRLGIPVLESVTLTLGKGEALILRGPNGIGKTTLLRSLAGLQPSPKGRIDIAEESLVYAGHSDGLKATLTVNENLHFWAEIFQNTVVLSEIFKEMNLSALRHRRAGEMSAGQKRRLGLARLLVSGRAVWLLDEPTVSLDTASVALFAGVVARHLAQGGGVIAATHIDLGLAGARVLDLTGFRARPPAQGGARSCFDEAFV